MDSISIQPYLKINWKNTLLCIRFDARKCIFSELQTIKIMDIMCCNLNIHSFSRFYPASYAILHSSYYACVKCTFEKKIHHDDCNDRSETVQ